MILELIYWICLSLSLSLPRAPTNTKTLSEDLFFEPVSFLELLQFPWTPSVFIPTCEIFFKDFLENG